MSEELKNVNEELEEVFEEDDVMDVTEVKKESIKEKVLGMLKVLNDEKAAVLETKAALLKVSDKETKKALKKELKEHKTAILKIRAKLMAIPVAILVGIGLFSAVRAALHGKGNEIVDVEAEEVSDDVDETYEDDAPVEE